ncbi:hypothetical protein [Specibacter cremeus]|uniref:hypothetical protein n=1 Tax=Specibacter cremeus TaxID=1629051 RepID=UPI00197B4EAC|nr:hypothetical protein [Specibacter cremeus]
MLDDVVVEVALDEDGEVAIGAGLDAGSPEDEFGVSSLAVSRSSGYVATGSVAMVR